MSRQPGQKSESWQASVQQLTETKVAVLTRSRHRATEREWDAIQEALRWLKEHERLMRHVLPDLRCWLTAVQSASGRESRSLIPPC
jgi:hypothetical protein